MSDEFDNNELKANLNKLKSKKKLTVPDEFLNNAKSYDDKLILVKMLTEREKNRVLLVIKSLLRDAVDGKDRK
jgi:hypothetical protein